MALFIMRTCSAQKYYYMDTKYEKKRIKLMASELEFDQNISITEIDANFYVFSTKLASDAVRME